MVKGGLPTCGWSSDHWSRRLKWALLTSKAKISWETGKKKRKNGKQSFLLRKFLIFLDKKMSACNGSAIFSLFFIFFIYLSSLKFGDFENFQILMPKFWTAIMRVQLIWEEDHASCWWNILIALTSSEAKCISGLFLVLENFKFFQKTFQNLNVFFQNLSKNFVFLKFFKI